ncbi:MAG TPA: Fur family transcriptional regulator [Candidatus Paceibacterota bacterium]|nr:Fur family transcriptional regulator [Candidatus Paceibacterota bacterium]
MSHQNEKELTTLLRRKGFRVTPGRLETLSVLQKARAPINVEEILEKLKTEPNKVTVYRALKEFKEAGVVRQVDFQHNHAHYELAILAEHHHLVCLHCGRIEDVHRCGVGEIQAAALRASKHFAEIRQHALEFYGVCKACSKKPT